MSENESGEDVQIVQVESQTDTENDDEFEVRRNVSVKKAKVEKEEEALVKSEDDETVDGCPICFEPWTSGGLHRVCSLRCETWLNNGARSKCPQCNSPATKKDVRVLFVKRLVALDTSARDVLLRQLEDERIAKKRLQESETKLRLAYGLVSAEVNLLKEQLRMLQETGPNQQFSLSNARFVRAVNFDPKIQCRCIAFDPHLQLFVVGVNLWQNNGNNGKGFGIAKVSILDASRLDYLHGLHEQFVKSLHCSPFADGLVLTTSFDRTLKLSSLNTNGTLLSYELCAPGWSCSFHPTDRNLLFAGMANGTVSMYDIRNTRNAEWTVAVTSKSGDPMPIHSLNVCPTANGYCLALANLQSPIIVDISSRGALERISYPTIPVSGQCSSLVHDAKSGIWTAAMRGQISHHIYGTISEEGWWNATASYSCEHRQTSMVKSAALPIESQSLFAVPDGSSTRLSLLNMLGECIESSELHTNSINPILDTILARVDKKIFAGLLSERQLSLFSF